MTEKHFTPTPDQSTSFREALGCFGTGVTVITTDSAKGPRAITVNSFTSVSLDPPLVLWCLAKDSNRFDDFNASQHYSIHVMAEDQQDQALRFARDGKDFSHAEWSRDVTGRPQLSGCLARFDCQLHARHDAGDHLILVGQVQHAMYRTGKGLIFKRGQFGGFADLI
ncbi:flavin reductase family protein [Ruegeria sp. R14_0]|uniref:flavin reductase family protein n=1 Tax=Ruegeria sp. R14_0 TaxID=2821100 RepID=UPI001ADCA7D0|nr:flavin reductase family protein [Ruegeria sp. R14_0]MBO9446118.1 flavin reductase family protein [Ruegeria sp. R14_0]